ncbi:MAG: AAA family ATPase [Phycisphaerae bacterium]|nr:AAA family ATPase [Phycisphaerae bacterium]
MVTGEDDAARAIVPRLKAVDADLTRIKILEYPCLDLFLSSAPLVVEAQRIPDCKLIIIDPVTAFMGACNQNDNSEVRRVMRGLGDVAVKTNTAIVLVTHLSKKIELGVKLRVLGSVGFAAAARSVWVVFQKPEDADTRLPSPVRPSGSMGRGFTKHGNRSRGSGC